MCGVREQHSGKQKNGVLVCPFLVLLLHTHLLCGFGGQPPHLQTIGDSANRRVLIDKVSFSTLKIRNGIGGGDLVFVFCCIFLCQKSYSP